MERIAFFTCFYSPADRITDGGGLKEEGEDIEVVEVTLMEAASMVAAGEIVDAKTVILIQYLTDRARDSQRTQPRRTTSAELPVAPRPGLQSHLAYFSMSYILGRRGGILFRELGHDEVVRFLTTNLNEEGGQDEANAVALRKGVSTKLSNAA